MKQPKTEVLGGLFKSFDKKVLLGILDISFLLFTQIHYFQVIL